MPAAPSEPVDLGRAPLARPSGAGVGSRLAFGRIAVPGLNGSTPHLSPPPLPVDRSVFDEIAHAGAASALRPEPRIDLPAAPVIDVVALDPAPTVAPSVDLETEIPAPTVAVVAPAAEEPETPLPEPSPPTLAVEALSPEPVRRAEPAAEPGPAEADRTAEPLVSATAFAAIEHSFQALAASMVMQNAGQIDATVRELLRPMLKGWLDDNLPAIVERLVRAEIERVARGARA